MPPGEACCIGRFTLSFIHFLRSSIVLWMPDMDMGDFRYKASYKLKNVPTPRISKMIIDKIDAVIRDTIGYGFDIETRVKEMRERVRHYAVNTIGHNMATAGEIGQYDVIVNDAGLIVISYKQYSCVVTSTIEVTVYAEMIQ